MRERIYFGFSKIVTVFCLALFFFGVPFSAGQDISAVPPEAKNAAELEPVEPLRIKLAVNEVQLDVVVVDKKGNPITDLTAADFEIYQNELPQEVASGVYIRNQIETAAPPFASRKDAPAILKLPGATLKEEDVCRTIVFVVDNLSLAFQQLHRAKMSIKGFMEKQMQSCDMVAVIRTGYGNSALGFFSSDKNQINARVDAIPLEGPPEEVYLGEEVNLDDGTLLRIYSNQLSTVSYSIRAMKDMPGRKILFLLTSLPMLEIKMSTFFGIGAEEAVINPSANPSEIFGSQLNRLADEALRAGVVVHTMDAMGLYCAERNEVVCDSPNPNKANSFNELSYKTGGLFVKDSNFFLNGIGREANNMIAGYYLLSYVPPQTTFNVSRKNVYHRIVVKVKRKGAVVHTRDGFYGRIESETDSAASTFPLRDAIFSPFKHADLNLNISAGYIKGADASYLVRSWIHLDPGNIKIVETENGGAKIDLETVCLTSDINGQVHDFKHLNYTFNIKPENKAENLAWIKKHGIRFSVLLPVKKHGLYTVRIAVQDTESGSTGSAWQSLEIPDLTRKGLALSDIFVITSADDLNGMLSDATKQIDEGVFAPVFQSEEVRSPALRTYMPGDNFHTLLILYNADTKAVAASDIEIQSILYKDGMEYQRAEAVPLTRENAESHGGIMIFRRFTIGPDMPPGDYVLQMLATDRKNSKKKESVAVQTLRFTVSERSGK